MELNALKMSICRVPAFSLNDKLESVWSDLKAKIKTSSPTFYQQIATVEVQEIHTLSDKVQFTIWKYFNRAKYRATPFANFASYTVIPIGNNDEAIKINSQMLSHTFINWQHKENLNFNQVEAFKRTTVLYTNTSVYISGNEIRYLNFKESNFELASVQNCKELNSIITYCRSKRNKTKVFEYMKQEHQLNDKECKNLLIQLINLQLIHTDYSPNITGEDYFTRLGFTTKTLTDGFEETELETENYIIAERKLKKGTLAIDKSRKISEALLFLAKHSQKAQNNQLVKFKNDFIKKFEYVEISLAKAMDPELGIGYGNLAQHELEDELVEELLRLSHKPSLAKSLSYSAMHQFLINQLIENKSICLENFEETQINNNTLPNTLSVMCHFYKDNVVVSSAGGCTANALMGRFTLANSQLKQHCKEIAEQEEKANPNVLFFDIPYQAESKIDNVNRRKNCYQQELPILTWSCLKEPLDFNDVMVSVQKDEIVLYSKRLGKRLIPRLASAYNYNRSDLAVYRFLCDLQHQSIQSNLNFDIQTYLPDLNYYPRVSYKSVILSPAQWLLPKAIYQQKNTQNEKLIELKNWFTNKKINFFIKTGISDQTLCFNPEVISDLVALLNYCKQQGDRAIYLAEALIDEQNGVQDESDKKYLAEFVINFYHNEQIYEALPIKDLTIVKPTIVQTQFVPGSEWLYAEIYCHPSKSNGLLCNEITELLKIHKTEIIQWFFIRYDENGKHLRLRLHLKEITFMQLVLDTLNKLLIPAKTNGIITAFLLNTYCREIPRYGDNQIERVENFFYLDSKLVFSRLSKKYNNAQLHQDTLKFMTKLSQICFPSNDGQLLFVKQMSDIFAAEFNISQQGFKKINQAYTNLRKKPKMAFNSYERNFKSLENQAQIIFKHCTPVEKSKMLADLIHMHLNRIFSNNQRLHEAICYQFFYKQLLNERSREYVEVGDKFSA